MDMLKLPLDFFYSVTFVFLQLRMLHESGTYRICAKPAGTSRHMTSKRRRIDVV